MTPEQEAERELQAHIAIGDEGQRFLSSQFGKSLLGAAQQDLDAALDDFEACDVTDHAKVMDLQNKVRLARRIPNWLNELLSRAQESEAVLRAKQHTD